MMQIQIWKPGQKIKNERFEIIKELGKGGFGITYLAQDTHRKQRVVIKTLNANQQSDPNFSDTQERFLKEGFILKTFHHPHIVKVYEPIHVDPLWGLVMEYIDGCDLNDYTKEKGHLNEAEALGYIDQIAQALDVVHQQNFFHRDVKPHNIMLRENRREAVLIDFGIAREYIDQQTVYLSNSWGTEFYKPIEQYEQKGKFGPYTDIYALTVTLYHLLTGSPPGGGSPLYAAKSRKDAQNGGFGKQMEEVMWGELVKFGISDRTQAAIKAGMEIEPTARPQTMTEFRELLGLVNKSSNTKSKYPHQTFTFDTAKIEVVGGKVNIIKQSKQAEYIVEDLGSGVKLEMVYIPGGSFMMGSPPGEENGNEKPQHLVNVPAFYMGKYPITQSQYLALMGKNPSHFQGGDLPVESVSWLDAQEFCDRLKAKTGKKYRLPSEAEWEYAARGGTTTPFHFGETITTDVANFDGNYTYGDAPEGKYLEKTNPVGSYKVANDLGLYDLHGNVLEWCLDEWVDNYKGAPTDGSPRGDILSRDENKLRLLRGGSWGISPGDCRSAFRDWGSAVHRDGDFGFRVVFPQTL
jgi:formylglycine-generating enzyme required for sulfatase activity/tRNA A-37 threonylcarbamoyl transferase component Bud32